MAYADESTKWGGVLRDAMSTIWEMESRRRPHESCNEYKYGQYVKDFTEEERKMFEDFVIRYQLEDYRKDYSSPEFSEKKARAFMKGCGVLNTCADEELIEMFDDNGQECYDVDPDLIDWDGLFEYIKNGGTKKYCIHYYAGFACICMEFTKNGTEINCYNTDDYLQQFIQETLDDVEEPGIILTGYPEWTYNYIKNAIEDIRAERAKGLTFPWD